MLRVLGFSTSSGSTGSGEAYDCYIRGPAGQGCNEVGLRLYLILRHSHMFWNPKLYTPKPHVSSKNPGPRNIANLQRNSIRGPAWAGFRRFRLHPKP